jgi:ribosomal protein L37AE/L43A
MLLSSLLDGAQSVLHSFFVTCSCCCIAAFVFFIALFLYSLTRGGVVFRVGNMRGRSPGNYGNRYGPEKPEEPAELKAIRSAEKVMCEHCGSWVDSTETICPNCGAPMEKSH